jgi:RHS repeat-associated protein
LVYFHRNHQYSVTAVTTSTGAIAERYAYSAYGQPTILNASGLPLTPQSSTLSNRYTYTGREWDASLSLHHFRARWMSPSAGRFLGRDPIGYEGSEWGLYEAFGSRSPKSLDPTGKIIVTCNCSCRQGRGSIQFTEPKQVECQEGDYCCANACNYSKCITGTSSDRCGNKYPVTNCFNCGWGPGDPGGQCPYPQRPMLRYKAEFGGRFDQCASAYWRLYRELGPTLFCVVYVKEPRLQALCVLAANGYPAFVCTEIVCAVPGSSPNPPQPGSPNY